MRSNGTKPLVSAILTTHNRAELLPRALDSVIKQSYNNLEIIVIDDASTDETPAIMEKYCKEYSIIYIRLEKSVGACRARNRGIKEAKGDFIAGLDDDDAWHENRISELLKAYSDEYACITSDNMMIFPRRKSVWKKRKIITLHNLLYTNQVGNQVLARRDRVLDVGGFDPNLRAAQDYDLWIRLCEKYGPILNVQKPLQTVYMDHKEGRITESSSFEGYYQFYKKHKLKFSRSQRKYQLYKIRRAQKKTITFLEFLNWVPPYRWEKDIKKWIAQKIFSE